MLVLLGVAEFMMILEATVVNVALPSVGRALSSLPAGAGYATGLLPGLLIIGAGTGLLFPAASVTALSDVPEDRAGLASGLLTAAHEIGAALGVAVLSAVATVQAAAGGGFAAGYRHGFAVAAGIAAGLTLAAALAVPAVRPAPGTRTGGH